SHSTDSWLRSVVDPFNDFIDDGVENRLGEVITVVKLVGKREDVAIKVVTFNAPGVETVDFFTPLVLTFANLQGQFKDSTVLPGTDRRVRCGGDCARGGGC